MPRKLYYFIFTLIASLSFIGLSACSLTQNANATKTKAFIKSPNDAKVYHSFTLSNKLEVLAISDPAADKAAASLDINIGSGSDPENRQGLAHFLEHMLFLGTKKYPEPDEYQRFINSHGGSQNAFTSLEHTNYFFDIDTNHLASALDRFSEFFISPLFNENYVEREKHAVNAEYQARLKDDLRRQFDVLKTIANPSHPFSKFTVGNAETLADDQPQSLRDDLLAFYHQYYSANKMKLVVVGKESVEELEQLIQAKFSAIPNQSHSEKKKHARTAARIAKQPLYPKGLLPARINITPINEIRRLRLQFPIPDPQAYYEQKPVQYLANLLGHEGPGSLLSFLKNQGWVENLSASQGISGKGYATFQLELGLTKDGLNQITNISRAIFEEIELIREHGIEPWRYLEQNRLNNIAFTYQENGANINLASMLSNRMHNFPTDHIMWAPYAMEEYNKLQITNYLNELTPDNLLMIVVAKELTTNKETKWYSTPYSQLEINESQQKEWLKPISHGALQLPTKNPFIPERLTLLAPSKNPKLTPELISKDKDLALWYKFDNSFGTPRANFYFSIRSPQANQTPRNTVLTELYVDMVNEQLSEFTYPAFLANLNYQLYKHVRGVTVRISGFEDKQPVLLKEILRTLTKPNIDSEKFKLIKQRMMRQLANTRKARPSNQASGKISELLITPSWSVPELEVALSGVTYKDIEGFVPQFLNSIEVVSLANGNIDKTSAIEMASLIKQTLMESVTTKPVPRVKVAKISVNSNQRFELNVPHPDSAVAMYFQASNKTVHSQATFSLLSQIISIPFFHELRTQKQLGYIVQASSISLLDVPGLVFIVQSPNHSSEDLVKNIEQFTTSYHTKISRMDTVEFEQHKQALITRLQTKDTRLGQRTNRYWREIDRENYNFNSKEKLTEVVQNLSLEEIQKAYALYLAGTNERQLTVLANGQSARDKGVNQAETVLAEAIITDVKALQNSGQYFPL